MRFGICASFREIANFPEIPFDYLEEGVQRLLVPERDEQAFLALWQEVRPLPIPIETANVLLPSDLRLIETPTQHVDRPRIQRYIQTVVQRAERVGIRVIVFGSGGPRSCPAGYDPESAQAQIAEHLSHWSEWGEQHGVTFALEPLRFQETNMINTVEQGAAVIRAIDRPNARLLADVYHMVANQEGPGELIPAVPLLAHVHLAEQEGRSAPGRHGDDFRPYFRALRRGGYDARISIECQWHDLAQEAPLAIARLRSQWAESI